jgi:hypothetical protein
VNNYQNKLQTERKSVMRQSPKSGQLIRLDSGGCIRACAAGRPVAVSDPREAFKIPAVSRFAPTGSGTHS